MKLTGKSYKSVLDMVRGTSDNPEFIKMCEATMLVKWNPYTKVVHNHETGVISHEATDVVRRKLGLPVPWRSELAELEAKLPPIYETFPKSCTPAGYYRNKKNGRRYLAFDEVINATNANDGEIMIAYRSCVTNEACVREVSEFLTKFRLESDTVISFTLAKPPMVNAEVTFEGDEVAHPAYVKRDAEGNLLVTVDALEPVSGTPVFFVNKDENNSEYQGKVVLRDKILVFEA